MSSHSKLADYNLSKQMKVLQSFMQQYSAKHYVFVDASTDALV